MSALLKVEGLTRIFSNDGGRINGVSNASFSIDEGEFFSLIGPSGCGKSSLLRCIAGLEQPDEGRIAIGDTVVFSANDRVHLTPQARGLGMVFQDLALWPHMTVFENVEFPLQARSKRKRLGRLRKTQNSPFYNQVMEALELVGIEEKASATPAELSGGQQQRVAIARAIVNRPPLILMDEPLSALDIQIKERIRRDLRNLATELQLAIVYVTHDQQEAFMLSDRIAVMDSGLIVQIGTPEEIYQTPANRFVSEFVGDSNPTEHGTILRPEHLRLSEDGQFHGTVLAATYLGGHWLIEADIAGAPRPWHFYHHQAITPGSTIRLEHSIAATSPLNIENDRKIHAGS